MDQLTICPFSIPLYYSTYMTWLGSDVVHQSWSLYVPFWFGGDMKLAVVWNSILEPQVH